MSFGVSRASKSQCLAIDPLGLFGVAERGNNGALITQAAGLADLVVEVVWVGRDELLVNRGGFLERLFRLGFIECLQKETELGEILARRMSASRDAPGTP